MHEADRATTMAFMTLALAQIGHLGNARSAGPVLRFKRAAANPYALAGVAVSVAMQLGAITVEPLARLLRLVPLDPGDWIIVIALSALPAVVGQAIRLVRAGA